MFLLDRKNATVIGLSIIAISLIVNMYMPSFFWYFYLIGISILMLPSIRGAIKSTLRFKIKIDTLMVIATIGAILLGHLEDAVLILLLYNIAEMLEDVFLDRAKKDLEDLTQNLPRKVSKMENGEIREISIEECKVGDVVIIKPGQMVPFDGEVVDTNVLVDESSVTGEPYPVFKPPGSKIYSGSIVLRRPLKLKIEKDFDNSLLMTIVKRVMDALKQRSQFERYVRRVSNYMSPLVLIGFLAVLLFGYFTGSFNTWTYRGLAILVVGCPSAFLISTAIVSYRALSKLLREGVLVKGSYYFEALSKTKIVALDKTGTVTLGKPTIVDIITFDNVQQDEVLKIASSLEVYSSHPIAKAIVEEASKRGIEFMEVKEVEEILGKGLIGELSDGKRILIGNKDLLKSYNIQIPENNQNEQGITVYVALDSKLIGIIKLMDKPMEGAENLKKYLDKLGVEAVLITGDKKEEAERIANMLGLKEWYAEMKPDDKVKVVKKLKEKGKTIMIGDGINDAMSLAEADVGIAVIKPGLDIVQTSAGIEVHKWGNLNLLPNLIKIGRKYMSTVKKIVYIAIGVKISLIILALMGLLPLWGAVLGDDGLTIVLALYALQQKFSLK